MQTPRIQFRSEEPEAVPARGLRGTGQVQGDLRDVQGGTFDHPAGLGPLPRGLAHREGPLNKTSGRAPLKAKPKA